jgi:hypothetical protein
MTLTIFQANKIFLINSEKQKLKNLKKTEEVATLAK